MSGLDRCVEGLPTYEEMEHGRAELKALRAAHLALIGLMWRFDPDDTDDNSPEDIAPDIEAARRSLRVLEAYK